MEDKKGSGRRGETGISKRNEDNEINREAEVGKRK